MKKAKKVSFSKSVTPNMHGDSTLGVTVTLVF